LGNLVLALGVSGGLHAALLSTLDLLPIQWVGATQLRLTLRVEEPVVEPRSTSPLPSGKPTTPKSGKAVAPTTAVGKNEPERYLTSREVDQPARPRGTVPLIYPENPLIWKLHGVVRLRLLISELGAVDGAEVVNAEPPGEFEEAALDAARRMRYDPAVKNGRPVKSQKLIEVTFDPHERKEKR
jgi:TonB family protein